MQRHRVTKDHKKQKYTSHNSAAAGKTDTKSSPDDQYSEEDWGGVQPLMLQRIQSTLSLRKWWITASSFIYLFLCSPFHTGHCQWFQVVPLINLVKRLKWSKPFSVQCGKHRKHRCQGTNRERVGNTDYTSSLSPMKSWCLSLLSLHSSHTQTPLLLDGLQLVRADGLRDQI